MAQYEYKVIEAPRTAEKLRGIKSVQGRFAATVEALLSEHGAEGWEFQRSETLAVEDKRLLSKSKSGDVTLLVFRREIAEAEAIATPEPDARPLGAATARAEGQAPRLGPARDGADADDAA